MSNRPAGELADPKMVAEHLRAGAAMAVAYGVDAVNVHRDLLMAAVFHLEEHAGVVHEPAPAVLDVDSREAPVVGPATLNP